jgi:RNA polymerase sigma-70 factor, ECF subfamily
MAIRGRLSFDQVFLFRVLYDHGTLTTLARARLSSPPRPFEVARPRPRVPDCSVSQKPALRPEHTGEDDRQLLELPLGFDQLFRVHAPYVAALVLKLIGRPGYVDDVVQDVFIQAHRGMGKLRDVEAVRPWLRRIAVRRARRWLRKRWVLRWFRELDVDAQTDLVDASASPEERAQVARIYRNLERLPEDERLVWVLRLVEGETLESIAEMLACSVSTVQRRLRAAQAAMGELR